MIIKERKILKNGATIIITKKRKLKTRFKILIVLCYLFIFILGFKAYNNYLDNLYKKCDEKLGHTCSYYDMQLLNKRGDLYE